jgi:hypothetical protein
VELITAISQNEKISILGSVSHAWERNLHVPFPLLIIEEWKRCGERDTVLSLDTFVGLIARAPFPVNSISQNEKMSIPGSVNHANPPLLCGEEISTFVSSPFPLLSIKSASREAPKSRQKIVPGPPVEFGEIPAPP